MRPNRVCKTRGCSLNDEAPFLQSFLKKSLMDLCFLCFLLFIFG
jgi:hypothetical protein